ncbi:MAG: hypothetical protein GX221_02930 [Candidatus Riflebacteria bacterium]|nr:hypothetical protein [Candidatus Riflebacteria bacterium]
MNNEVADFLAKHAFDIFLIIVFFVLLVIHLVMPDTDLEELTEEEKPNPLERMLVTEPTDDDELDD